MAKGKWTRKKEKVGTLKSRPKLTQTCPSKITPEKLGVTMWVGPPHARSATSFCWSA